MLSYEDFARTMGRIPARRLFVLRKDLIPTASTVAVLVTVTVDADGRKAALKSAETVVVAVT
jgi:hypothetical protein